MCHKVSAETGLTFNSIMTYYFLESVLSKLSNSEYNNKFIFKGGYILSNIVGLDSRSTVDIDFLIKNMAFDEKFLIDKGFNDRWNAYVNKNIYIKDTPFKNVIESIQLLTEKII